MALSYAEGEAVQRVIAHLSGRPAYSHGPIPTREKAVQDLGFLAQHARVRYVTYDADAATAALETGWKNDTDCAELRRLAEVFFDGLERVHARISGTCNFDAMESAAPANEGFARDMDALNTFATEVYGELETAYTVAVNRGLLPQQDDTTDAEQR